MTALNTAFTGDFLLDAMLSGSGAPAQHSIAAAAAARGAGC